MQVLCKEVEPVRGIIFKLAKVFKQNNPSLDFEDLVQEAQIAAWQGICAYDPSKSALSTYVYSCVKNALNRYKEKIDPLRVPNYIREAENSIKKGKAVDAKTAKVVQKGCVDFISLNGVYGASDSELSNVIEDKRDDFGDIEQEIDDNNARNVFYSLIERCGLTERERLILNEYLALKSIAGVGRKFNLTKEGVTWVLNSVVRKAKLRMQVDRLEKFL